MCYIFVALYPVTSVTLRGVELFGLNLGSFLIYARAWVQARNFLQDNCVLWAWTSFQHTAMIPPCAFLSWLHGLHGEAFEEAGFFIFIFVFVLFHSLASSMVGCIFQVGHQESESIRLLSKSHINPYTRNQTISFCFDRRSIRLAVCGLSRSCRSDVC